MAKTDRLFGYLHSLPHSLSAGESALQAHAGSAQPLTTLMGNCCDLPPPFSTNQQGREKSQQDYFCQYMTEKTHSIPKDLVIP